MKKRQSEVRLTLKLADKVTDGHFSSRAALAAVDDADEGARALRAERVEQEEEATQVTFLFLTTI